MKSRSGLSLSAMIKNKRLRRLLIFIAFYIDELFWLILDLLPQFLSVPIFKLVLGQFGRNSSIDYKAYIRYPWKVFIGDDSQVARGCMILPSMQCKDITITLGSHIQVAPNVVFAAAGHDYRYLDLPDIAGSIVIKDYVWIGAGSIILPGITIGEGAIIGAGSIVSRDIPPYSIAAGVPAKVIRPRVLAKDELAT